MATWPNNKCGLCGVTTDPNALAKLTCPKCGTECCQHCGPKAVNGPCRKCGWKFGPDRFDPNTKSEYPSRR